MFNLEQQIRLWRIDLLQSGIKNPEVIDELESHLRDETQRLIDSGRSEMEAFNTACTQLGESETLTKEFAKLNRHWLWAYRDNPWQIKLFGLWFIIHGLNGVTTLIRMYSAGFSNFNIVPYIIVTLSLLQIPLGIGLLRRQNIWRAYAFVWTAIVMTAWIRTVFMIISTQNIPARTGNANFIGITVSHEVLYVIGMISTFMLVWASYILAHPSIRNLYRTAKAD